MEYDIPPDISNNVVFRHLWDVPHEQRGNLIIITNGMPRTGKSELNVNFAWNLYRGSGGDFEHKFEVKKHCKWSKLDFQKTVHKYKEVGACPVWDEAGIAELGAHARQFWSEGNIAISTLFQIMGFHRQVAFISLPMKMMLDKHLRLLSHVSIETFKIKRKKNRCLAKVWWLEMSSKSNEAYSKYPRYIGSDGLRYRVKTISVPRAPPEIREEYIVYSEVFKEWLERKLIREEEARGDVKSRVSITAQLKLIFEKIKKDPDSYWNKKYNRPDTNAIRLLEDVTRSQAFVLRGWMLRENIKGRV